MRGRWFLTACIFVLLAAAAALVSSKLDWPVALMTSRRAVTASPPPSVAPEEADPLEAFRTEREQLRSMQTAQLNDIIHDGETDSQTRALAQRTLIDLMAWSEQETTIEGVLRARGYADCVATIHEDTANVLVRAEALTRQETAVILELVLRETDVDSGNVKIIPIN